MKPKTILKMLLVSLLLLIPLFIELNKPKPKVKRIEIPAKHNITTPKPQKHVILNIMCYTPSIDETDNTPNITFTGQKPIPGKTAAVSRDRKDLIGKTLVSKEYGEWIINDIMGSSKKNTINFCFKSKHDCKQFGVRKNVDFTVKN